MVVMVGGQALQPSLTRPYISLISYHLYIARLTGIRSSEWPSRPTVGSVGLTLANGNDTQQRA